MSIFEWFTNQLMTSEKKIIKIEENIYKMQEIL